MYSISHPPTASGAQSVTPLLVAIWNKQPAAAKRLLEKGADIEAKDRVREHPLRPRGSSHYP
jgi:ankyrin repeat protein